MTEPTKKRTVVIDPSDKEKIDFYKKAAKDYVKRIPEWAKHYLYTKPFYTVEKELNTTTVDYFHDLASIVKALNLPGGSKILDVACGPGWLSEYLYRFGYAVTGIDISPDLLKIASERVDSLPFASANWNKNHIRFVLLDLESESLDEQFDAIVFYDCLHHFVDEEKVMHNTTKMLTPAGKVLIKEGSMPPPNSQGELTLLRESDEYSTLESPFDHAYLLELLRKYGLKHIKEYVEINGFFEKTKDNLSKIQKVFTEPYEVNFIVAQRDFIVPNLPNLLGRWSANMSVLSIKKKERASSDELRIQLKIKNIGDVCWTRDSTLAPGSVALGFKLYDSKGGLLEEHVGRVPIPHDVAPSDSFDFSAYYLLPNSLGISEYRIQIDLVLQGYFWFKDKGSDALMLHALRKNDSWEIEESSSPNIKSGNPN